jgi:hypothetical protein
MVLVLVLLYVGYLSWSLYKMETTFSKLENTLVTVHMDKGEIQEIGYILDSITTRDFGKKRKNIIWWIKIPETDEVYICDWQVGFAGYQKNDGIVLIHVPHGGPNGYMDEGYILGLHGNNKDKITAIEWIDADIVADEAD